MDGAAGGRAAFFRARGGVAEGRGGAGVGANGGACWVLSAGRGESGVEGGMSRVPGAPWTKLLSKSLESLVLRERAVDARTKATALD